MKKLFSCIKSIFFKREDTKSNNIPSAPCGHKVLPFRGGLMPGTYEIDRDLFYIQAE